jgi:parvulin-like peptidyl-prolyl isomerase
MKINKKLLTILLLAMTATPLHVFAASQILVTIGKLQVTSDDLNSATASSPFETQSVSMSEDDQAGLRGDMLRRLVAARLLALEAQRLGLDKAAAFQQDVESFRLGLLYNFYMDKLRARIVVPKDVLASMKEQFKVDHEGLAAAKSAYIAQQYQVFKASTLRSMLDADKAKLHEERIVEGVTADTVLLEGRSFKIRYGDIVDMKEHPTLPNPEWVKGQLYNRGELLLVARVAEKQHINVSVKLKQYQTEKLPAVMLDAKIKEWIPGEQTLHDWFDKHPEVAVIPERRHVGQLVVATRQEAEALRARIVNGESLFTLASELSIDPLGKKQSGDMGWFAAGRGMPELEQALSTLEEDKLSEVIETKAGFHLLLILDRKLKSLKSFEDVRDRVRQMIINENLPKYLGELERQYKVSWNVFKKPEESGKKAE